MKTMMKSPITKRSVVINGHRTSTSLEDEFWQLLKHAADEKDLTLSELVSTIDKKRRADGKCNLGSAIRVYVLNEVMNGGRYG